jgi:hypothetical protein
VTRPLADVERVQALLAQGMSESETARRSGIPQRTVNKWTRAGVAHVAGTRATRERCDPCPHIGGLPPATYAYLLGLYLGDGCLASYPRGVYRLHVSLDAKYPRIVEECRTAVGQVLPNRVGTLSRNGRTDVVSYSKHWPCLFPQHGPGKKHTRPIVLERWQQRIVTAHPVILLRGLIHSDGWRGTNHVGSYAYGRYMFSNRSDDIRGIFVSACQTVGLDCRPTNRWNVAVSRRNDVAFLDRFIGNKR